MNMLLNIMLIALPWTPLVVREPFRAVSTRDTTVNYIVVHNDSSPDPKTTFWFLRKKHTSYNYYIDKSGTIHKLIDPKYKANHAGLSRYAGYWGMNKYSIGICLENIPPQSYRDIQYKSLAWLVNDLQKRFPDSRSKPIIGHEDVALPIGRKSDPGKQFDWNKLNFYLDIYRNYDIYQRSIARRK